VRAVQATIEVVIADDHDGLRTLIRLGLEEHGLTVVGEARSGPEAVALAVEHRPALCLLDVSMPGGGGLAAVAEITRLAPEIRCVMLTSGESDADLLMALRNGACGYLAKSLDIARVADALRGVLRGEAALSRITMTRVLDELRVEPTPGTTRVVDLTDDEWALVEAHRRGRSTADRRWAGRRRLQRSG
jgi:two-component system, NarL family, nitrate/nitrite response regulator NarL